MRDKLQIRYARKQLSHGPQGTGPSTRFRALDAHWPSIPRTFGAARSAGVTRVFGDSMNFGAARAFQNLGSSVPLYPSMLLCPPVSPMALGNRRAFQFIIVIRMVQEDKVGKKEVGKTGRKIRMYPINLSHFPFSPKYWSWNLLFKYFLSLIEKRIQ